MTKTLTIFAFLLVFAFGFLAPKAHAQAGSMMGIDNDETAAVSEDGHGESVELVLQEILNQQNVSTVQELDLTKISDGEWERLGDAVMELQHPGEAHEAMDRMMGGEGSQSLRQMHINMGKTYLGYGNGSYGSGMTRLRQGFGGQVMSGGMAGSGMMSFGSMMGYGGNFAVHMALVSVTWVALIVFLVTGSLYFIKGSKRK